MSSSTFDEKAMKKLRRFFPGLCLNEASCPESCTEPHVRKVNQVSKTVSIPCQIINSLLPLLYRATGSDETICAKLASKNLFSCFSLRPDLKAPGISECGWLVRKSSFWSDNLSREDQLFYGFVAKTISKKAIKKAIAEIVPEPAKAVPEPPSLPLPPSSSASSSSSAAISSPLSVSSTSTSPSSSAVLSSVKRILLTLLNEKQKQAIDLNAKLQQCLQQIDAL